MRISILGTGNLSRHLASGFHTQGVDIVQVYGRRIDAAYEIALPIKAEGIDSMSKLRSDVDLVLLAVSDSAIEQVLSEIPNQGDFKMIAHTAGCVSATPIPMLCPNGVFYPLQTFSKDRVIDWSTVPIFLTSEHNADLKILEKAANLLSKQVSVINDQERLVLHLCATLVNNFSNHLFALSEKIATESGYFLL